MILTRHSKIKEVWGHPLGHDILLHLLHRNGRGTRWLEGPLVANLPITVLDRYAWPGFADFILDTCGGERSPLAPPEGEAPAWWKEAVLYQVYLPSFMDADHDGMGDLRGVLQRLPYLQRLGADVLWLRPLLPESAEGGVLDYKAVEPNTGNCEDFEALAEAAHTRGMRLIMSLELSSLSEEHPWFQNALQGGEYRDYFFWRTGKADAPPNNWEYAPGHEAWKYFPQRGAWVLCSQGQRRIDLNWDNPKLRQEMADILRFWQEKGADGFAFGGASLICKTSFDNGDVVARSLLGRTGFEHYGYGPRLPRYLRELCDAALPKDTLILGEVQGFGTSMAQLLTEEGRSGLDMVLDQSHLSSSLRAQCGEDGLDLQDLRRYYLYWMEHYAGRHWMSLFLENANTPRLLGRLGANPLFRSILAKMLGSWLFTLRGTPILYQGEELGLSNTRFSSAEELCVLESRRQYADLCSRQGFAEGAALQKVLRTAADHARTPIPWCAGPGAGFTGAIPWARLPDGAEHLNAACQAADPGSVLQHYQSLIALRKQYPALVYGSFAPVFVKNKKVLCYFRILGGQKCYVELNLTERQVPRPGRILRSQRLLLSNYDAPAKALRPYEANLYLCENS